MPWIFPAGLPGGNHNPDRWVRDGLKVQSQERTVTSPLKRVLEFYWSRLCESVVRVTKQHQVLGDF